MDPTGVIGLLGLVSTCFEIIELGFVASDRKDDLNILSLQLGFEEILLARWADNVGICGNNLNRGNTKVIPPVYYDLIEKALKSILNLFDIATGLVVRHERRNTDVHIVDISREHNICHKIVQIAKTKAVTRTAPVCWAIRDGSKLEKLVGKFSTIRGRLFELLPEDITLLERQLLVDTVTTSTRESMPTIRQAVAEMSQRSQQIQRSQLEADVLSTVQSAVSVRQALPIWESNQRAALGNPSGYLLEDATFPNQLKPENLSRWMARLQSSKVTSGSCNVIIEWKHSDLDDSGGGPEELESHVIQLIKLLFSVDGHPNYHIPKCIGYIKDEKYYKGPRYGLVFESPVVGGVRPSTLYDIILNTEFPFELSIRFRLARQFAISIYYLLCTGWLHKGIRSANVLVFDRQPGSNPTVLEDPDFALLGFGFARPNQPRQKSTNEKDNEILDFYRHPYCVSRMWQTEEYKSNGYQKIYDIYSLGVFLAEIGMWRTASNINSSRLRNKPQEEFYVYLRHKAKAELPLSMGQTYADAVTRCLNGDFDIDLPNPNGEQLLAAFDEMVLQPIGMCRV